MDNLIFALNRLSQPWWSFMMASSVQITLFSVIILALSWVFKKQSAPFLYWLWFLGLLKIIIPPTIPLPSFVPSSYLIPANNLAIFEIAEIQFSPIPAAALNFQSYLFGAWLVAIISLLIFWLHQQWRFQKTVIRNAQDITQRMKPMGQRLQFFTGPNIIIPFTRGIFAPKIYLPEAVLTWSDQEQNALILHEVGHIQRKDLYVILLQNLVQWLYFFHPLVWLVNIQLSRHREKACDDFAIHQLRGDALAYSRLLLKSLNQSIGWQAVLSPSTYFHHSRKSLMNRFDYILNRKETNMTRLKLSQQLLLIGLLVLGIALSCQRQEQPSQPKESFVYKNVPIDLSKATLQAGLTDQQKVDYDIPPMPEGGFEALGEYLLFPEFSKDIGSIINIEVTAKGQLHSLQYQYRTKANQSGNIMASIATQNYEKKLANAIQRVNWTPAQKNGQPIDAWITLPIQYVQKLRPEEIVSAAEVPPPRPPMSAEDIEFVPYDEPPSPVGGFAAIHQNLVYPELARKAGIEGQVIVQAHIGASGEVLNTRIFQSLGENNGCDEAAVAAIKATKWLPARNKGKPVAVWVSIPVRFKLKALSDTGSTEANASGKEMPPPIPFEKGSTDLPFDKPPLPVGGFQALQQNLVYPESARKAGVQGQVTVQVEFDEAGNIVSTKLLTAMENQECNDAAIAAIKSVKWHPAEAKGKPVPARIAVPIRYNLMK
ncbi:MAG: TonB family protein [candidate division KSB1 bacterium]|nr:TonB family protein [candidate division KSB1 bacterium]MDZ7340494.1 TonB family protein [candidate division KSB1 bacterium]